MKKFKIGDRVRMICRDSYVPYDELGTVWEINGSPDVMWDNYKSPSRGSIWAVSQSSLELVNEKSNYEIY